MTKIAVVGCGYWGQNLVRKFFELGALSAICDENAQQAEKMANLYGNPSILSMEEIEHSPDIDGVVLASPAMLHANHAERFLKAGKHVFVEKPLALTLEDAKRIEKIAQEQQRILMVGHILQYHPAYIALRELTQQGSLGKLRYVYSNRLSLGKVRVEENVLWSFAPHDISMILGLIQAPIESVHAVGSSHLSKDIQDVTTLNLTFSEGYKAHIFVSWLHPFKEQKLVVVGEKGMAVFDDVQDWKNKLKIYRHQAEVKNKLPIVVKDEGAAVKLDEKEPLKQECQHFINCIQTGQSPITDAREAIKVLEILSLAQVSLDAVKDGNI